MTYAGRANAVLDHLHGHRMGNSRLAVHLEGQSPPIMKIRIPSGCKTEVSLAYDILTCRPRYLGSGRQSYANASKTEICGTWDLVKPGFIGDYKTGHTVLGPAADSAQLAMGALCVDILRPVGDGVAVEYIYVREGSPAPWHDRAFLTREDLAAFAARLSIMAASIIEARSGTARYREGLHCRHCPAWDFCPPKHLFLDSLSEETDLGTAYIRTRELEAKAKKALVTIKEHADRLPGGRVELGGGRFYGLSKRGKYEEYIEQ